jgi:hypothetical protein
VPADYEYQRAPPARPLVLLASVAIADGTIDPADGVLREVARPLDVAEHPAVMHLNAKQRRRAINYLASVGRMQRSPLRPLPFPNRKGSAELTIE